MDDDVTLRLVAEDDLAILERLTQDPESTGEYAWLGWHHLTRYRQWFAENRLVSDDIGILMVVRGDDRLGFVSWFKVRSSGPWRRPGSPGRACSAASAGGTAPTGTGSGTACCATSSPAELVPVSSPR